MPVSIVGAGPGDVGLLTIKAKQRLERCDVLIYDRLVPRQILALAPATAHKIYVGKNPDGLATPQDRINELLVEHGSTGCSVVRLKGGDPFVFGRGAEEAQALKAAGIDFELVPGISSAFAAPAYAGIPVTHRSISPMVTIVTGHRFVSAPGVDWAALGAHGGTLVVLMGVRQLGSITGGLIRGGMGPDTPVAAVMWATRSEQSVLRWSLGELHQRLGPTGSGGDVGVTSPAVIVIGPVVDEATPWFEHRPLFGLKIAMPRPAGGETALADGLRQLGADVLDQGVTRIVPLPLPSFPDIAARYHTGGEEPIGRAVDWIAFTSSRGVSAFVDGALTSHGLDARALHGHRIAAIGETTARSLGRFGLLPDVVAPTPTGTSLAEALIAETDQGATIWLPRAERGSPEIVQLLTDADRDVRAIACYATRPVPVSEWPRSLTEPDQLDALILTAGSTARSLAGGWDELFGRRPSEVITPDVRVIALGTSTSQGAHAAGFHVDAIADRPDVDALLEAICTADS
ncbi:MAG: uroporphyrinogen-III C-methyltransferase [Actinobacteria bacterium]|nr:uroporphyrinogen-III C-methyltransferase [Actinomycetota bacterium]MCB9390410.1 uroporphyrinogen-III C-methyltransferase [Acidimicrobiia bacterium]